MLKALRSPLLALVFIVGLAGAAVATLPAVDFGPATPLSRGTLGESVHYNTGEVKFQTKGAVDFVTQTVTIGGRVGSSGWHSHPGVVLVTVKSGTLVRYDADCSPTTYAAGSAFTESGDAPALVRNNTTAPAVVYVTFVVPAGATPLRIDAPQPLGCNQT